MIIRTGEPVKGVLGADIGAGIDRVAVAECLAYDIAVGVVSVCEIGSCEAGEGFEPRVETAARGRWTKGEG